MNRYFVNETWNERVQGGTTTILILRFRKNLFMATSAHLEENSIKSTSANRITSFCWLFQKQAILL
jgi:hypothetical protein